MTVTLRDVVIDGCHTGIRANGGHIYAKGLHIRNAVEGMSLHNGATANLDSSSFNQVRFPIIQGGYAALKGAKSAINSSPIGYSLRTTLNEELSKAATASSDADRRGAYSRFMEATANHAQVLSVAIQLVQAAFGLG